MLQVLSHKSYISISLTIFSFTLPTSVTIAPFFQDFANFAQNSMIIGTGRQITVISAFETASSGFLKTLSTTLFFNACSRDSGLLLQPIRIYFSPFSANPREVPRSPKPIIATVLLVGILIFILPLAENR